MRRIQLHIDDVDCLVTVNESLSREQAITVALIKLGEAYPKIVDQVGLGRKENSKIKRFIEQRFKFNNSPHGTTQSNKEV